MSVARSARRRFVLWSAAVLIAVLPLWWLWGADLVLGLAQPLASLTFRLTGLPGAIDSSAAGWRIATGLPLASGEGLFVLDMGRDSLRRPLLGFPLFLAFICAPPRSTHPWRAILIGGAVLTLVFLLGLTATVWGEIATALNPSLAPGRDLPDVALTAPPLHPAVTQLVLLGRYAGISIAPLLAAVLAWAAVNPQGVAAMAPSPQTPQTSS